MGVRMGWKGKKIPIYTLLLLENYPLCKANLKIHTGIYQQRYLDEFCYCFNRRHSRKPLFDHLLVCSVWAPYKTVAELGILSFTFYIQPYMENRGQSICLKCFMACCGATSFFHNSTSQFPIFSSDSELNQSNAVYLA